MYRGYERIETKARRRPRCVTSVADHASKSSTEVNISHCLINGVLMHVSGVKSGYHKDYICLDCGKSLIAKKGEIKAHHFAHTSVMDGENCGYNEMSVSRHVETLAHKMGKSIIENEMRSICVPAIKRRLSDEDAFGNDINVDLASPKDGSDFLIDYTSACSEVHYGPVTPDVVVETATGPLAVEIAVSHFCDNEKIKKLAALNLPAIEIDLSKVVSSMKTEYGVYFECFQYDDRFQNYIAEGVSDVKNIRWISVSKGKKEIMDRHLIAKIEFEKAKKQSEYDEKKQRELAAIEAARKKSEEEKRFLDFAQKRRSEQVDANNTLALRYMKNFHNIYNFSEADTLKAFGVSADELCKHEYGDFVFCCTSYLWKSLILALVVEGKWRRFSIKDIDSGLRKYIEIVKFTKKHGIDNRDNCHYWKSISAFLKTFCEFDVEHGAWLVNDAVCKIFLRADLIEMENNYKNLIENQILAKLKVNDGVRWVVGRMAATTNAFDYQCVDGEVSELEIYRSDRFARFDATLTFLGKHDYQSPFAGSEIRVDLSGVASLDDDDADIVEHVAFDDDNNESLHAYVSNLMGAEGTDYLWVNNEKVPMTFFEEERA